MKAEVERADEAAALNERIQQLRTEHESDLDLLYDIHANDYLNEVMDWHASMAEFPSDDVEGKKTLVRPFSHVTPRTSIHLALQGKTRRIL